MRPPSAPAAPVFVSSIAARVTPLRLRWARGGSGFASALRAAWPEWWPVWLGLAVLFLPTMVDLFTGAWIGAQQGHGPMILALSLWLIWRKWPLVRALAPAASKLAGALVLACALLLHLLGRTQQILMFEVGAIGLVLVAIVLVKRGAGALRVLWFPFFFMLFMVPLPGELVASVTMPMKMAVSWATEHILFGAGYPIARSGVMLQVGPYQLLVADACAGLQTLLTLEALGLFYLNLLRHPSPLRNVGLAVLIVPISFSANVIRVIVLTLVTFYMGDAAGRGFLHGFAGIVLFLSALALILALDSALQWAARRRHRRAISPSQAPQACSARGPANEAPAPPGWNDAITPAPARDASPSTGIKRAGLGSSLALGGALLATAALTLALAPTSRLVPPHASFSLAAMVPARFGAWRIDPDVLPLAPNPEQQRALARIYDQTLSRTYIDAAGRRVMLSIAYGGEQSQALQLHLPEVCYLSQGFTLDAARQAQLPTAFGILPVQRLVARLGQRNEPMTYWITIGEHSTRSGLEQKLRRLAYGLAGEIPDGMLVRVSSIGPDAAAAWQLQDSFIRQLLAVLDGAARSRLIGSARAPAATSVQASTAAPAGADGPLP